MISARDLHCQLESHEDECVMWPGAAEEMVKEAGVTHPGYVTFDEFVVASYG